MIRLIRRFLAWREERMFERKMRAAMDGANEALYEINRKAYEEAGLEPPPKPKRRWFRGY